MANRSAAGSRLIDRRTVLQVAAALAAAGPALVHEGHAAARPPVVIDAQVHAYAANTPERPWHSVPNWPAHVTGDEMVAAMDKVGVDGAIYISPFSMYQYDGSYAVSVQRAHPDKFALVKPVNPDDPACARIVLCRPAVPSAPALRSTGSATGCPALFVGFVTTMAGSDFPRPCIIGWITPASPGALVTQFDGRHA